MCEDLTYPRGQLNIINYFISPYALEESALVQYFQRQQEMFVPEVEAKASCPRGNRMV